MSEATPKIIPRHRTYSSDSINQLRVQKLLGVGKDSPTLDRKTTADETVELKSLEPNIPTKVKVEISEAAEESRFIRASKSSLRGRPGYAPSIGSRHGSEHSLSSTVEKAAQLARSSTRSSSRGGLQPRILQATRKVKKLHIMKGASGLGIHIIGGKGSKFGDGIFIRQLEEGGAAFSHNCLHPGDELLMVDGKSLVGLAHEEAVAVLRATNKLVQLVVATDYNEGESVTSSLQSIPDHLLLRSVSVPPTATMHLQQQQQPSPPLMISVAPVEPEALHYPLFNSYHHQDTMEMTVLREDRIDGANTGQMETDLDVVMSPDCARHIVELHRDDGEPLGISLAQKEGAILIKSVDPHGVAGRFKGQLEGQQLVAVNDIPLHDKTKYDTIEILSDIKRGSIRLHIQTLTGSQHSNAKKLILHKTPGDRLGLQLTAGTKKGSVKVKNIAGGSPAHRCLNLSIGDELVSINGANVTDMGVDIVRTLLSSYPPGDIILEVVPEDQSTATMSLNEAELSTDSSSVSSHLPGQLHSSAGPPLPLAASDSEDSDESDISSIFGDEVIQQVKTDTFTDHQTAIHISGRMEFTPVLNRDQYSEMETNLPPESPPPAQLSQSPTPSSSESPDMAHGKGSVNVHQCPPNLIELEYRLRNKARGGLGITIVAAENYRYKYSSAQEGVFVIRKVTPGGVAAKDGRLKVGDQLISVNGESMINLSHAQVLQTINKAHKEMRMVVWRDPNPLASGSVSSLGSFSSGETGNSPPPNNWSRRLVVSPSPKDSPLVARYSFSASHIPLQNNAESAKRWSAGDTEGVKQTTSTDKLVQFNGNEPEPNLGLSKNPSSEPTQNLTIESQELPAQELAVDSQGIPGFEALEINLQKSAEDISTQKLPEVPMQEPPKVLMQEPPKTFTQESLEVPMEEPPEVPTQKPPEVPMEEPPELPIQELPENLMQDSPEVPTQKPPEVPIQEPPENPMQEFPEVPMQEPPEVPMQEPPEVPMQEPPEIPMQEPPEVPMQEPPKVPLQEPPEVPMQEPPETPKREPPEVPMEEPPEIPKQKPVEVPAMEPPEVQTAKVVSSEISNIEFSSTSSNSSSASNRVPKTAKPASHNPAPTSMGPGPGPGQDNKSTAQDSGEVISDSKQRTSLKVPRGKRMLDVPFEIELNKGLLGIGAKVTTNEMGMIAIKSLSARSIVAKDNTIRVGDILLGINDDSIIGWSASKVESTLKSLPRGNFRLTAMAPPKDVSGPILAPGTSATPTIATVKPSLPAQSPPKATQKIASVISFPGPSPPDTSPPDTSPPCPSPPDASPPGLKPGPSPPDPSPTGISLFGATTANIGMSANNKRGSVHEGIIEVTLERQQGQQLGFILEGGYGSEMIHIKALVPHSPASQCGLCHAGDQVVMVGEECLVGKSLREANVVLDQAPSPVTLVLQRKLSPNLSEAKAGKSLQNSSFDPKTTKSPQSSCPTSKVPVQVGSGHATKLQTSRANSSSMTDIAKNEEESRDDQTQLQPPTVVLSSAVSTDNLPNQFQSKGMTKAVSTILPESSEVNKFTLTKACSEGELNIPVMEPVTSAPEETITVRLTRGEGEKFGLKVAGGRDHPSLRQVHVKQILPDGVAHKDGTIRRGDRLLSVNGTTATNLTNREALQLLKEAGNDMTLVLNRKVRRISRQTTPIASRDVSRAESRRWSPQRSPRTSRRGGYGTGSSDEGSREGSRGPSPQSTRRHRRRESVTVEGEVVNLRDRQSTLPRKIRGAKTGVRLVDLHKGPTGLGMKVDGSSDGTTPITVKSVLRGGAADKSHSIHVGDEILEVNKTSFEKYSQKQAMEFFKALPQGKVSIILRNPELAQ